MTKIVGVSRMHLALKGKPCVFVALLLCNKTELEKLVTMYKWKVQGWRVCTSYIL